MSRGRSLRFRFIAPIVALLVLMGLVLQAVVANQMARQLSRVARDRAVDVASVLASALLAPVEFDDVAGMEGALQPLRHAEGVAYARVLPATGSRALASLHLAGEPVTGVDVAAGDVIDDGEVLHAAVAIRSGEGATLGRVVVGFSTGSLRAQIADARTSVLSLTAVLVALGALVAWAIGRRLVRPMEELSDATGRVVDERDLRLAIPVPEEQELGRLAGAIAGLIDAQRRSQRGIVSLADDVARVSGGVDVAGAVVSHETRRIGEQVALTARTVRDVRATLARSDDEARAGQQAAQEVNGILQQVNDANDRVADVLRGLAEGSRATAAAVEDLARVASDARRQLGDGDVALEHAARTMQMVETAARHVERGTQQTRELSLKVREGAAAGRGLLADVHGGVEALGAIVDDVQETVSSLAERTTQIDVALRVIEDVADQTALLALNASILAAQAGAHGEGFAVVANAIKALSDRTRASVASIGVIIDEVTAEASMAVSTVSRRREAIVAGTRRTSEATSAIEQILSDTGGATERLEEIAVLAAEQLKGVREVARALGQVGDTIGRIRSASKLQEEAAARLRGTARQLIDLTGAANGSLVGHGERSAQASRAISRLGDIITGLASSQGHQAELLESVLVDVDRIAEAGERQARPVQDLLAAIAVLRGSASDLASEARRFRV